MYRVKLYGRVRRAVHVEGMSTREASRVFGLHRDTVRKMLRYSVPPGYRRERPPRRPKLDPYKGVIDRILEDDQSLPKKQRHTGKRIYDRLRDEHGFPGKYTIVKDYVRERRRQTREMFVPLSHPPGQAQCDYGEARVIIDGVEQKAHYFAMDLPHSDGCFVKAYPAETTESFCDGHRFSLCVPGRSTSEHCVRQHHACGGKDTGGRPASADQGVLRAAVPLPSTFPLSFPLPGRPNRSSHRGVCPAELHGTRTVV